MHADAVIVGGGLAGSATAWALSKRRRKVVLLEAFWPGHTKGSSHGSARVFRRAYTDPFYVRLTGDAAELWRQLEDQAAEQLVIKTGAIDFGPGPKPVRLYEVLAAQHVPAKLLTPEEAAERWPYIAFDSQDTVMYHPEGGVIDADRATAVMCRIASENGADIRYQLRSLALTRRPEPSTPATSHSVPALSSSLPGHGWSHYSPSRSLYRR